MFKNEDEFKRLIEQLKIEYPSNAAHELELRNQSLEAFGKSSPSIVKIKLKRAWEVIMNSKITRYAAVIIILLIASYTIGVLNEEPGSAAKTEVVAEVNEGVSEVQDVTPEFLKKFNEVKSLYDADDIGAVVKLLESDDMAIRMIAAEFLGKTSDIEVAKVLERLSGDQSCSALAEKFIEAAKKIRDNAEAEGEQGGDVEDEGQPGGVDANGVGFIAPAPAIEKGFLLLKVIDKETKKPITNLNICTQIGDGVSYYKTGNDWFCQIKLTKPEFGYFSVSVQADGYASARFVKDTDNPDYVVPLEYTIEMEKGVYVGGYLENEKGQRLAGYKVKIKCERKNTEIDRAYANIEAFCDANGMWKCNAVPAKFDYFKVTGDHSDYVGLEDSIEPGSEDHKLASALKYVVEVVEGIMIGGVIKNEEGEGVGGADVKVICRRVDENDRSRTIAEDVVFTDAKGNWQFGKVPNVEFKQIRLEVSHKDYIQDRARVDYNSDDFKLLEAKKFNTVLKRGEVIAGVVTDMDGRAIEGATVMFGTERYDRDNFVKIKTDSQGKFSNNKVKVNQYNMNNIQPGQVIVTVVKAGYAPEVMVVRPKTQKEQLEFVLELSYTISGRVVDVNGMPIEGVWMAVDEWRGFRTIEWREKTDGDGRFQWNDAPADEVKFSFGKKGYAYNSNEAISCQQEREIVLYPALKISGKVVDAQTGEAIKDFDITEGIDWLNGNNNIYFEKRTRKNISDPNGKYEVEIINDYPSHLLKVEAEGYTTSVSKAFKIEEMVVSYDFELTKAKPLEVVVKLPNGSIAENAQILISRPGEGIYFRDRSLSNRDSFTVTVTDADGRFSFSNRPENFSLVITHDEGFLIVAGEELMNLKEIVLEKWGKIQGYAYKGELPVAGQSVSVYCHIGFNSNDNVRPQINYSLTAITDANGFFEVEKVIPTERIQCSWFKKTGGSGENLVTEFVEVLSGGVTEVELLLQGRAVMGKIKIPDEIKGKWSSQVSGLSISPLANEIEKIHEEIRLKYWPEDYDDMTVREKIQWKEDFQKSEQYKKFTEEIHINSEKNGLHIRAIIGDDGNFKADGVSGGRRRLQGNLISIGRKDNKYEVLAKVDVEFEVPESEQLYCEEPFDLGEIKVKSLDEDLKKLIVGDMCPEFEAETADGEKVKFEDFRGKYLVLNINSYVRWDQGHAELLNKIYAQYKADDIEMLTVTHFYSFRQIKKFEENINVDWPMTYISHGRLESDYSRIYNIFKTFGCSSNEEVWFIVGPEGKILKAYIEFDELSNVLEEVFVSP